MNGKVLLTNGGLETALIFQDGFDLSLFAAIPLLNDGDPMELGAQYRPLKTMLPNLSVFGGCCGTNHRHVDAISMAVN